MYYCRFMFEQLNSFDKIDLLEDVASDDEEVVVISNTRNLSGAVKQVYKNKNILVEVTRHYTIVHKFRHNVVRSNSSW